MISKKTTTWILANTSLIQYYSNCTARYCNGAMKLVSVDDNGSCNASTYQLLDVRHLGCAQGEGKLLLFILLQGTVVITNTSKCGEGGT